MLHGVLSQALKFFASKGEEYLGSKSIDFVNEFFAFLETKFPIGLVDSAEKAVIEKCIPNLVLKAKELLAKHGGDPRQITERELLSALVAVLSATFA